MQKQRIPSWLKRAMSEEDLAAIEAAVSRAEASTSGEIIPMIVHRSSAIGHVAWLLWLFMILLILSVDSLLSAYLTPWTGIWSWGVLLMVLACYPLAVRLARLDSMQRLLTSNRDEMDQVHRRAELEFYRHRLNATRERTGILLFVSWMERRAIVLADQGVARHVPEAIWGELVQILVRHAHEQRWREGFEKAIVRCGEILSERLPRAEGEKSNEIRNHLIILE